MYRDQSTETVLVVRFINFKKPILQLTLKKTLAQVLSRTPIMQNTCETPTYLITVRISFMHHKPFQFTVYTKQYISLHQTAEAVAPTCKKGVLKVFANFTGNTSARVSY